MGCSGSISSKNLTSILPLTQDRRRALNTLTEYLNQKLIAAVARTKPPTGGFIEYIDPGSKFNGHRFCEEGVVEPSYKNPNIWFFPFEYSSAVAVPYISTFDNTTNCADIVGPTGSGDWGDYYACGLVEGIHQIEAVDPTLAGHVPAVIVGLDTADVGDGGADDASPGQNLPTQLVRIFHPTPAGHTAYRDTFVSAYLSPGIPSA